MKTQQLALLDPGHFQVAKGGSIQHANQQSGPLLTVLRPSRQGFSSNLNDCYE